VNFTFTSKKNRDNLVDNLFRSILQGRGVIMQSKRSKSLNHTVLNIQTALKEHLMKDFSASLASQIIEHNIRKHYVETRNHQEYAKLINAIASDYQAIKPLGHINVADLKKELRAAVRQLEK